MTASATHGSKSNSLTTRPRRRSSVSPRSAIPTPGFEAELHDVRDIASLWCPVRNAGGAPRRKLDRYRDHRIGADLLRHAAILGRADGDPAVLGRDGLAAEFWLRDGRRWLHRARSHTRCRRP